MHCCCHIAHGAQVVAVAAHGTFSHTAPHNAQSWLWQYVRMSIAISLHLDDVLQRGSSTLVVGGAAHGLAAHDSVLIDKGQTCVWCGLSALM